MGHLHHVRVLTAVLILVALARSHMPAASAAQQTPADREYMLEATITGYRGVGGEIDGIMNPVLFALTGQRVRITIVNIDLVLHDIALETMKIRSAQILDRGASASVTFTAKTSDTYYCTIPGHRAAGMEGRLEVADAPRPRPEGILPDADGAPLDLGFESGTLSNWTASGDAFTVVEGANVPNLASSVRTGHVGGYWVTSQIGGSARKGTLTSAPFRVRHPYASFLVSGGAFASTRVEIVLAAENTVIYSITGSNRALLRPAVVDLTPYRDKEIVVRLVDEESGAPTAVYLKESPWAHVNFDNFRFHETRPYFPDEVKPAEINTLPPVDHVLHAGLSARDAAAAMTVPKGFSVTVAASEPAVVRPIAFAIDDRGRLWVAEAHTYPERAEGETGKDRILILEDTDGNGTLDRRKVFIENLNLVSGLEVGFGGVWVGAPPYLMFIPKDAKTDRAGQPRILLDGWGYDDTHETLNTFTWGPDGWLYGTHGVFTHSVVGKPGTPEAQRERLNGGVWRYHPTRHQFEVFAHGTSNPWGIDFNDYGHAFITACVIEHLYHVIQGAKYKRQAGSHFNQYTYDDIKTVADHVHWVGRQGPHAGNNRSSAAGGGHAHAGAMIYLGGSAGWPNESRDSIYMHNIHGARTNADLLSRKGSGYTAAHGTDFLLTNDSWSQMLNLRYGPDGAVWAIDWYDKNQCHSDNFEIHQKTLGRIYKISSAADRPVKVDLASLPSERLVDMQLDRNDWYVRHARRILQERGSDPAVHARLKRILQTNGDVTRKLRAMWALHVTQGFSESELLQLMREAESEYVRSWAIQLLLDVPDVERAVSDAAIRQFEQLAQSDPSPLVRLYLASGLQRVPPAKRWGVLERLLAHVEDASDHNLPLLVWYAAEASVELDMPRALALTAESRLPQVFAFAVQRVAAVGTTEALRALADRLGRTDDVVQRRELGAGIVTIVGRKQ